MLTAYWCSMEACREEERELQVVDEQLDTVHVQLVW
jgi:hypothetical protein